LRISGGSATVQQIEQLVRAEIGAVPASSIRSYLRLNVGRGFKRLDRGVYRLTRLRENELPFETMDKSPPRVSIDLILGDCVKWLEHTKSCSIHAVVTDPPYGLFEYTPPQQAKLRNGNGGVWRIPPSFDGHTRSPLPRFTTLRKQDLEVLRAFFLTWGCAVMRVLVPGANVVLASNPLLSHIVSAALADAGLERRGEIVRLVMTMRGGDRPKNAHDEFPNVSVMPRSMWEPWLCFRKPLDGRVQDNLRHWGTGGFRRISADRPFGDVIVSSPTHPRERKLAPHPSLKPQAFLRQIVRAVLPLGMGTILDPFAGSGSTLAAAKAVGYSAIGIEIDPHYHGMARSAIERLAKFNVT
jgi:site-specific DNA-methyltransferase (adenine-specific)